MTDKDNLSRILKLLSLQCLDLDTILKKLTINRRELDVALTILEIHGYIEKIEYGDKCDTCPLYIECSSVSPILYRITEKGLKLVKKIQEE